MDDKIYVLYVDINKISVEDGCHALQELKKLFPDKTFIYLPKEFTLEEVERSQIIKDLQRTIDLLSQE